jgi:hypothetical protein
MNILLFFHAIWRSLLGYQQKPECHNSIGKATGAESTALYQSAAGLGLAQLPVKDLISLIFEACKRAPASDAQY